MLGAPVQMASKTTNETPLHTAAAEGMATIVQQLLDEDVDVLVCACTRRDRTSACCLVDHGEMTYSYGALRPLTLLAKGVAHEDDRHVSAHPCRRIGCLFYAPQRVCHRAWQF